MYENKKQKLASKSVYYGRVRKNLLTAFVVLMSCLFIGMMGYKILIPEFDWYDSLLNAAMILSGMGPVFEPSITLSKSAKVFAAVYALFSGITFLSAFGILIAPVMHRFFHQLHLNDES